MDDSTSVGSAVVTADAAVLVALLLEQGPRLIDSAALFFRGSPEAAVEHAPNAHPQIDDIQIFGVTALFRFGIGQSKTQTVG
jgi:hypothetical protein